MIYKLHFADGTELDNLTMSGTTLISETEIDPSTFNEEAMELVVMTDEDGEETVYQYAQTNGAFHKENGWCFTIWGASPAEIEMRQLREENEILEGAIAELAEIIGGE